MSDTANEHFLDLLEDYFAQPEVELKKDQRPEVHYQVGVTLEATEKVRPRHVRIAQESPVAIG